MFESHFKNEHAVSLSLKTHVPITCKAILKHVWITFQAHFMKKHAASPIYKIHVPITMKKQFWSMFGAHFKHISRIDVPHIL
jgi:hypothetical protein